MARMPAVRRRTGRKRLRSAEAGFVRGDDSDEAAELTHICQGCGKRCVSARSLNAHCGNCPCLRRPTIDETAPVSSWTTETEDQPLEYEDIDHQPDCNPELLRMFTDWRVHNMTDVDVQRVKEGIGTVLGVFKKKLRATFAHHEFPSLEEVFEHADFAWVEPQDTEKLTAVATERMLAHGYDPESHIETLVHRAGAWGMEQPSRTLLWH